MFFHKSIFFKNIYEIQRGLPLNGGGGREESWAMPQSLNWATRWQVVLSAEVENTGEKQATLEELSSLSPARCAKTRMFPPGSVLLNARAPRKSPA